jgi:hypothetical protein
MNPCETCCILPTCQRKFEKPKSCLHRPVLQSRVNASGGFANNTRWGRFNLSSSIGTDLRRMATAEHKIRQGLLEDV